MNWANLDINGIIALGVGVVGLLNTVLQLVANSKATATAADMVEVKKVVQETKVKTDAIAENNMAKLLDDVLIARKNK